MTDIDIRPADSKHLPAINKLAKQAMSVHNLDMTLLVKLNDEVTFDQDWLDNGAVYVAVVAGKLAGFYAMARLDGELRLGFIGVHPKLQRKHLGARLFNHAKTIANVFGENSFAIHPLPEAAAFFNAMGARKLREIDDPSLAGRKRPDMIVRLV